MTSTHEPDGQLDVSEHGAPRDGKPQVTDRRLFMQLVVVKADPDPGPNEALRSLGRELDAREAKAVIYEDVNHPNSLGVLSWSENPEDFVTKVRPAFAQQSGLTVRPEFTMLGRSYSSGFEPDLEYWLLKRPQDTVTNPAWPWAVWYPLRRSGAFEQLERRDKGHILREHAEIGKRYGAADLAHDVRLACHGLDANDNEFVIGLIGKELYPLSHVVQSMRATRQTSEFIVQMGPFFVGHTAWRSARSQQT